MKSLATQRLAIGNSIGKWATSLFVACCCTTMTQNACAFGIGDLVSAGLQAGGKLVGAAVDAGIDKAKDAMRDPEAETAKQKAEEKKAVEGFQKMLSEIEARRDLSPLQREQLTITFKKQYSQMQQLQQFIQAAEASQKAKRDQIFTGAGLVGVLGEAALSTPSMAMAQAEILSKSPEMRLHINSALRQATVLTASGIPQGQIQRTLAQADSAFKTGALQSGIKTAVNLAEIATNTRADISATTNPPEIAPSDPEQNAMVESTRGTVAPTLATDAFTPDIGKKVYLEFVGSASQTKSLRDALLRRGHTLANDKTGADVTYLIEGEYIINENKLHKGLKIGVGQLLDEPTKAIEKPAIKTMGAVGMSINKFLFGMAQAQGANIPTAALPKESNGFRQQVLVVIARQPREGAETRYSVLQEIESPEIEAASIAKAANGDLLNQLGLSLSD